MNALKNFVVFGALAAVCYGVYTSVMTAPTSDAPSDVAPEHSDEPSVELAEAQPSPLDPLPEGFSVDDVFNDFPDHEHDAPGAGQTTAIPAFEPQDSAFEPLAEPRDVGLEELLADDPSVDDPFAGVGAPAATNNQAPANAAPQGEVVFADLLADVSKPLEAGELTTALRKLTLWYGDERLSEEDHAKLTATLDDLAYRVVYSREHHLEQPYVASGVETLAEIGDRFQVPWRLLAKINGYMDPATRQAVDPGMLPKGTELKVVRGPFRAIVDVASGELLLLLGDDLYAGRFPVTMASGKPVEAKQYAVQAKQLAPAYTTPAGQTVSGDDPTNPFGGYWIGLTDEIGLHGSPDQDAGVGGALRLAERDIQDVYDILNVGSEVLILR